MSTSPGEAADPQERPERRIGDRERTATDARLRRAQDEGVLTLLEYDERARDCFAARYQRELDVLVADLPESAPASAPPPREPSTSAAPVPAAPPSRHPRRRERTGRRLRGAVLPAVAAVVALVVGPSVLGADQGSAVLGGRTVTADRGPVEVGVLFGRMTVVVPDGASVTTSGTLLLGGVDCEQACRTATAPPIQVATRGAFGSVRIETASEAARPDEQDRDRDRGD